MWCMYVCVFAYKVPVEARNAFSVCSECMHFEYRVHLLDRDLVVVNINPCVQCYSYPR
jgi:hypothetical protein